MKRFESGESVGGIEFSRRSEFVFAAPNTLLFLTGAPLSGKSTIAPLVASYIEGCAQQPMDIIRLLAKERENYKPEAERNPFVQHGACDSYTFVGDGSYSPESLVQGFNAYSGAVTSLLLEILPNLETQGVKNVLFEGVQLTPSLVSPFLTDANRLIVITSEESRLRSNTDVQYGENQELQERYSISKLLHLQQEILRQSEELPPGRVIYANNSGEISMTVSNIMNSLLNEGVILPK